MMRGKIKTFAADAGLLYAALIWGTTFVVVKDSLAHINPVALVAYRFLLSAFLLWVFLVFTKRHAFSHLKEGIILGVILWLVYIPQTIGLEITTASNSAFITGLFIVFVPLFSLIFFRSVPEKHRIVASVISLAGLWFLTGGYHHANKGDIITLITAMAYGAHILMADRYVKKNLDPYILSFQQFAVTSILSFLAMIVFGLSFKADFSKTFYVITFLALFPTLSAFVIQLVAQKFTKPVKVALIFAMEPVFAALFAWTYGGEIFILNRAFGGLLIVGGMILSELPIGNKTNSEK